MEDNAVNRKIVLHLLNKFGYQADTADNGLEAVRALETTSYEIVLMDVQMPEMDGVQATEVIRDPNSKVLNHQVPVIALTAHAMAGDRTKYLDKGMDDYLSKPISPEGLYKMIEKYVQKSMESQDVDI